MVQVLAERSLAHQRLEIAVRRGDHAGIDHNRTLAADAFELAFLQHAQQLGLHRRGHVADFVEKEGPAVRLLEFSEMPRGSAGERSALVSEQLRLDQLRRHGRAVDGDERALAPGAALVDRAGDQLLSGSGLPEDAHA